MVRTTNWNRRQFIAQGLGAALAIGASEWLCASTAEASPETYGSPRWLPSAIIYSIFPEIFSPTGDFAGITAQLPRLHTLGIDVIWLMPIYPIGKPVGSHPSFGSPYSASDFEAIDPRYGTEQDLKQLVKSAHRLGIKIILDVVLNHTSWDNALITAHPEYYEHTDANTSDPSSIRMAFNYADVAQLNYANAGLRAYIIGMLTLWITRFDIDGFRFDTADNPYGAQRHIPADFWHDLAAALKSRKRDLLLLGECEDPELANAPFDLDYGWHLWDSLTKAFQGGDAAGVRTVWEQQKHDFPAGFLHMTLQDNWDSDRDIRRFGGTDGALAATVFLLTTNGVPLIYNGMEVGNDVGAVNPHQKIDWSGKDSRFASLYGNLIALRRRNRALQQGALTWLDNSSPSHLLTYRRSDGGSEFLIAINVSDAPVSASVEGASTDWSDITPHGIFPDASGTVLPDIALPARGFAIFQRHAA